MSTSDKLTYLDTTKSKLKDSINALGGEIDNNTTFREYATELDTIYSNLPKTDFVEGTNITLENTLKGKLDFEDGIVGIGDTKQDSYEGYNLLVYPYNYQNGRDTSLDKNIENDLEVTGNTNLSNTTFFDIRNSISLKAGVTYTITRITECLSGDDTQSDTGQTELYLNNTWIKVLLMKSANSGTFTVAEDGIYTLRIKLGKLTTTSKFKLSNLMVYEGTTTKEYQKYYGGQASPNPSYPQDIEVVRGKNRFDQNIFPNATSNTRTLTNNNGTITLNGTSTGASNFNVTIDYTPIENETISISQLSGTFSGGEVQLVFIDNNGTNPVTAKIGTPATLVSGTKYTTARISIRPNVTCTNLIVGCQLEKGSQATSYLPYNTLEVKARGKNKLDFSEWLNTLMNKNPNITAGSIDSHTNNSITITSNGNDCFTASYTINNNATTNKSFCETYPNLVQEVKGNTKYTFSFERSNTSIISRPAFFFLDKDYNYLGLDDQDRTAVSSVTFTTPSNAKYLTLRFGIYNSTGSTLTISNLMIEESPSATNYEPYQTPQTYQLSLGEYEFAKIGNYADEILYDIDNDKFYKYGVIGKKTYIGNSSEVWKVHGSIANWFYIDNSVNCYTDNASSDYAMSNYYIQRKYNEVTSLTNGQFSLGVASGNLVKRLVFKNTNCTTVEQFTTWLGTHNTILYYVLATPATTEITDTTLKEQLKELYNMQSMSGTTIIEVDGDLPLNLKIRALKGE